eukprot:gnl/TRDRNA2_/TRDRNA2_37212_c0_seq1.p1 gnl/TRDRNA2_/TRDRNA2_37212_c0~~gnl/TRDRNA2_/TRDRNA2_37212_c0_seq1.p1  ORF type:complete len:183 (-),score=11.15 gnl/TRDRNA2_/TRDRNA2_37212_c0_seq1:127-675(-)
MAMSHSFQRISNDTSERVMVWFWPTLKIDEEHARANARSLRFIEPGEHTDWVLMDGIGLEACARYVLPGESERYHNCRETYQPGQQPGRTEVTVTDIIGTDVLPPLGSGPQEAIWDDLLSDDSPQNSPEGSPQNASDLASTGSLLERGPCILACALCFLMGFKLLRSFRMSTRWLQEPLLHT